MAKHIPENLLNQFLSSYQKDAIWQVHQLNDKRLIVFLFHDEQIDSNKDLPIYDQMKADYFKLAKEHLDNVPLSQNEITIDFDTKENFESKFHGNWYSYYH